MRKIKRLKRAPVVHLQWGNTKLVRRGDYLSPIACNQPKARLMSSDEADITCRRCNHFLDAQGRHWYCGVKSGITRITKYHWPQVDVSDLRRAIGRDR